MRTRHALALASLACVALVAPETIARKATIPPIRGINLGGWLVTEPWITPSVFRSRVGGSRESDDEWSLCASLGKDNCLKRLQPHWESFYVKDDIAEIKSRGLNHLRIPIGYWAVVPLLPFEPYVPGQYPYLVRAVQWARELNMSVLIDVHGAPGSQNGQDNSGLTGPVLFAENSTNVDRTLAVIQNLTAEFSQPIYGGAVKAIQLLNEPRLSDDIFNMEQLQDFYSRAAAIVRSTDTAGNLKVSIHDAFWGLKFWASYDPLDRGSRKSPDWLQLDTHQYYAFAPLQNLPRQEILERICTVGGTIKSNSSGIAQAVVGEWSLETGHPPNTTSNPNGGLSQSRRNWLRMLFEAQLAAYSQGWYFWCWKTEYDIDTWSYSYGVNNGYIPSDVSNASTLAYPVLQEGPGAGCIDAGFNYTVPDAAPRSVLHACPGARQWTLLRCALLVLAAVTFGEWVI